MAQFNRQAWNWFPLLISLFLCASCAVTEITDYYNESHFLFIPVDAKASAYTCVIFLVIQLLAIYYNKLYTNKAGWRHQQVQGNIYNNRGDKVGSYDTGEYDSWYVTPEQAENTTAKVRYWAEIARIALPRVFLVGCIASWISPNHIFWGIVIWLAVAPAWTIWRIKRTIDTERSIIWEVIYCILLLVCSIVYFIIIS